MKITTTEQNYLKSLKTVDDYLGKGELTKEVLKGIAFGGMVASLFVLPGLAPGVKFLMDIDDKRKKKLRRSLHSLVQQGYVKEVKKNKYAITPKGHIRLYKYAISDLTIPKQTTWDGYFRIITFDIPEYKKYARNTLNKKLKELGFITLQRSIYVYPFNFVSEFEQIGKMFGIEQEIIYLTTKDISNYEFLRKEFIKLKVLD